MSSIRNELVALDTNQYVFAVRRDSGHAACRTLLFDFAKELRIYVPREVVREVRRNLLPAEVLAAFAPLRRALDVVWDFAAPPADAVERYRGLGAKTGDALIAAHLDASGVHVLVSENRHFLAEIRDLPFRVMSAEEVVAGLR